MNPRVGKMQRDGLLHLPAPFRCIIPIPRYGSDLLLEYDDCTPRVLIDLAYDFPGWKLFWQPAPGESENPSLYITDLVYRPRVNTVQAAIADLNGWYPTGADVTAEQLAEERRLTVVDRPQGQLIEVSPPEDTMGGGPMLYVIANANRGALLLAMDMFTRWDLHRFDIGPA